MKIIRLLVLVGFVISHQACSTVKNVPTGVKNTPSTYGVADGKVEWIFLQVNDVYEIAPLDGGKSGGWHA